MKKSALLTIVAVLGFSWAAKGGTAFSQEDRDLLIELRTRMMEIDKRFDQIDRRFEQVDKRFEELRLDTNTRFGQLMTIIYVITGIFGAMTISVIGFAVWDRRTMIRPFETKVNEIEKKIEVNRENTQKIISFQKDYASKDRQYSDVLHRHKLS